jgi:transcriptional regulator with XRE-family HTH domain
MSAHVSNQIIDLRTARQIARLTQQQLAARARVDPALISRLETGARRRPSYEVIVRIARALNLAPDQLFPVDADDEVA